MRIGVIGGTGKEGRGLVLRWARAGHELIIGSRDEARAAAVAAELGAVVDKRIAGGSNADAAAAEVVVVSVPYGGHAETLRTLAPALTGRIVIDLVVPLQPPKVSQVHLPAGGAAALEARAILGEGARIVAALHHVSSTQLEDLDHAMLGDVLIASDDRAALDTVTALVADLGMRGVDAGALANAVALEAMTPVLIHMNKRYKRHGLGITIAGLDDEAYRASGKK
jgi:8-hydroxy-5-deazaflavin:NADPH oxidoreductase